jgi:small-conductance mechanosensitive channel
MEKPPLPLPQHKKKIGRTLNATRVVSLALCLLTLALCSVYIWMTQDTVAQLSFMRQRNANRTTPGTRKAIVSIEPWQTASTLLPMAVSAEEQDYAMAAERLADHDVDQAFALALRLASLRSRRIALTGQAQEIAQQVANLELVVKQDKLVVHQLGGDAPASDAAKKTPATDDSNDDLETARAQLSLDSGELEDARHNLAHFSGDNSDQIQQELSSYHQAQQQAQSAFHLATAHAVAAARQHRTLLMRVQSLRHQNERARLIEQAAAQISDEITSLALERASTQKMLQALAAAHTSGSRLEQLQDRNCARQILAIYDDRIAGDKILASVYAKWTAQIAVQHRILLHLIVVSLAWVVATILALILAGMLTQRLLEHFQLDNRQTHTLRTLTRMGLQLTGAAVLLLIVFGVPAQLSTVLGLTTAALTIALQDFVLAFFGWFLLIGRHGIHVGDWVEINGVNGEVIEVGLFNTSLLELSSLTSMGQHTGRRIAFLNSFAIRGQYFNFSTSGQWMWDEVRIGIPKNLDVHQVAAEIEQLVTEKTADNARAAELDWTRVARGSGLTKLAAASTISLRPTVEGIEATVHYITRATDRFAMRDKIYLQLLALLQEKQAKLTP